MDHLEIELKFHFADFAQLQSQLRDGDAACTTPDTLERNVLYDTKDRRLLKSGCLLRLRSDHETTLTFKSPPPESDGRFKAYREREARIDDFDTMDAILAALGFHRTQIYEKRRETWRWHGTTLCLDTLPYGRFLEIEGQPDPIVRVVELLGLSWERRILATYLGMFALLKDKAGLPFDEITFDNFAALDAPFDRYLHLFEAGHGGSPD